MSDEDRVQADPRNDNDPSRLVARENPLAAEPEVMERTDSNVVVDDNENGIESNDSLQVNVEFDGNDNYVESDVDDVDVDNAGDEAHTDGESSTSSDSDSNYGQGDTMSYSSSAESFPEALSVASTAATTPLTTSTSEAGSSYQSLPDGKYADLITQTRPRPRSGHRFVVSLNEVIQRSTQGSRTTWGPSYARRIECILKHEMDKAVEPNPVRAISQTLAAVQEIPIHGFDVLYSRLHGHFERNVDYDASSDSDENVIRNINTPHETKNKKSCLKISREGTVGEFRPKMLSWSKYVYVANSQIQKQEDVETRKTKAKSCPGIYYRGELTIEIISERSDPRLRQKSLIRWKSMMKTVRRALRFFNCEAVPPAHVQSKTNIYEHDTKSSPACLSKSKILESRDRSTRMVESRSSKNCCFPARRKKYKKFRTSSSSS